MPDETSSSLYTARRKADRPDRPTLTVLVPCFNEEAVLGEFISRTRPVLEASGLTCDYLFIDDGSTDATAPIIARALDEGLPGRLIGLTRNFGKEAALSAGLDHVDADLVLIIDADLQDPPELIPEMVAGWRAGYDVVYGLRVDRSSDTLVKRGTAGLFYRLFKHLSPIDMPANAGDFRLIDRSVVEDLKRLPERNRFMKGLFAWVGHPAMALPYERPSRAAGRTKFNYWKLWNFAIDGLTGFTTMPLRVWFYGGALIALLAFLYALYLVVRVMVFGIDLPGYASLMVGLLFFSGVQLLSIGMIGEYVARLFAEAKQRPVYLVQEIIGGRADRTTSQDMPPETPAP